MSKGLIIGITVAVLLIGLIATPIATFMGYYDEAVVHEKGIEAQYKSDENALAQLSLKVVEMMQVANSHTDDMVKIINAAMKGKYGDEGATAKMLWSNEATQTIDPSLKKDVMRAISGGRSNFEQMQNVRIDKCRVYDVLRDQLVSGFFLNLGGFPKVDNLDKMCTPVSSNHARKTFESGIDEGLNLKDV